MTYLNISKNGNIVQWKTILFFLICEIIWMHS
jgi:hypothetical protein